MSVKPLNVSHTDGRAYSRGGRVAVLVRSYAHSSLNGQAPVYWFNSKAESLGLDPWKQIKGVRAHPSGKAYDIVFADGSRMTFGPLRTIYLAAKDAERIAASKP